MTTTAAARDRPLRVRVVVLNWNGAALTRRCIRSLLATDTGPHRMEIVVVDNGSVDGSVPVLRHEFPDLRIVENAANLGFAEGCNRAMRDLDDVDAVALVNNDVTVDPGWLLPLAAALAADDRVGAVAPKLLLAAEFVTVDVEVGGTGDRARLLSVTDGRNDLTARVLPGHGVAQPADKHVPLLLGREIAATGELHVPVGPEVTELHLRFATSRPLTVRCGGDAVTATGADGTAGEVAAAVTVDAERHRRINNVGTGLTPWCEGVERRAGERDRELPSEEVPGWCGGGVLLRADYLRDVGWFDPGFFAYYEDTDLSWRGRRRGWRTVTAPTSVLHHVHGATGGSTWPGFFFLNYRNWLLTVLRNGSPTEIAAALRNAWHLSWPYARFNVVGPVRRGRRPDWRITGSWLRVAAGLAVAAGPALATRRRRRVGDHPTDDVAAALLPASHPRAPRPRPGGPVVCYVDVTETLRSGWRAGIQRVVTELVVRLLVTDADLELVPVLWDPLDAGYRRLDRAETARLLSPPPMRNHPPPPPAPSTLRRLVGPLTRVPLVSTLKAAIRRRRAEGARPAVHRDLRIESFAPGSVFFDVDATWNLTDADRTRLLAEMTADRVTSVHLVHDLLPITHPTWFDPNLVRVFERHLDAHLDHSELFVCNSHHTAAELSAHCARTGRPEPATTVVRFGGDSGTTDVEAAADRDLLDALAGRSYLLTVGTIEPRKNHALLLEAFDALRERHPELCLVVVGRQGWRIDDVADRIRSHPLAGSDVLWPSSVADATLHELYRGALLTLVPSFTEGFGLPVIEALRHGSPVLASSGGALREAGGEVAEYADPGEVAEWVAAVERHLDDADHHAAARGRVAAYRPPGWDDTAAEVAELLVAAGRGDTTRPTGSARGNGQRAASTSR